MTTQNHPPIPTKTVDRIRGYLHSLRLYRLEAVIETELLRATHDQQPLSTFVERILAVEADSLVERRIERRITQSRLPERKLLSDFDFAFQSGVRREQIMELSTLTFVEKKQGLILAGNSGTGKSHIAKALLLCGCRQMYRCRYTTAAGMLRDLTAGLADDTLEERLKTYTKPQILLIDEVGFDRLEQESSRHASLFFKVIDGRYGRSSTLVTTNIDFKALGDYLGDPVLTASLVDRMIHHSLIITIEGPSYRIFESKKLNKATVKVSSRSSSSKPASPSSGSEDKSIPT